MSSSHFNVVWMGGLAKPHIIKQLRAHQKINHFPRYIVYTVNSIEAYSDQVWLAYKYTHIHTRARGSLGIEV